MYNLVNKYNEFAKNALKEKYTYRFRAIMFSCSAVLNMLIQYFLWLSIYREVDGSFLGVEKSNYIAYITFGVIFYILTSNMEYMNIASDIKTGNILMNLTKPISYKLMIFSRYLGGKAGDLIGLIPLSVVAVVLCRDYRIDGQTGLLFGISTVLAFVISFLYSYIIGMLAFWTINYWGVHLLTSAFMLLFSGQLMAINFYIQLGQGTAAGSSIAFLHTAGVQFFFCILGKLSYALPYQSIYYTPMSIFSKMIQTPKDIMIHLGLQIFWIIVLHLVSCVMWKKAQKKLTILGG